MRVQSPLVDDRQFAVEIAWFPISPPPGPDVGVETCWLGTCTDRLGVITGVRGIGVLGEHLLLANRDGAVGRFFCAAQR